MTDKPKGVSGDMSAGTATIALGGAPKSIPTMPVFGLTFGVLGHHVAIKFDGLVDPNNPTSQEAPIMTFTLEQIEEMQKALAAAVERVKRM